MGIIFSGGIIEEDHYTRSESIATQIIYLDFDGEETSYNGKLLSVDEVTVEDSGLTVERIAGIAAKLNELFAGRDVVFVTEKPESGSYSTVFIGKTDAFSGLGELTGIAETVDEGNVDSSDNAFVLLDAENSDEQFIAVIAHEAGHLLGDSHDGDGIAAFLNNSTLDVSAATETGVVLIADGGAEYPYSRMNVYGEGVATGTVISGGGEMYVSEGGEALDTTIETGGVAYVSDGGLMSGADISADIHVFSGGVASAVNVNNGATLRVSGGVADGTVLYAGGNVRVYSGGTANSGIVYGGTYRAHEYGILNDTLLLAGSIELQAQANATRTTISGGAMNVYGGAQVNTITVDGGSVTIYAGAQVNDATILSNTLYLYGSANGVTLNGGILRGLNGGVANDVVIQLGGFAVSSGGSANRTVLSGGSLNLSGGGQVVSTTLSGGTLTVLANGMAEATVLSGGTMNLQANAAADDTVVLAGGTMYVNGTATGINQSGGKLYVNNGGVVENVTVSGGDTIISAGGTVSGGGVYNSELHTYGTTNDVVLSGGILRTFNGGVTNDVVMRQGNYAVSSGGIANRTSVYSGSLNISAGGQATVTTVFSGGALHIRGGVAADATVYLGGNLVTSAGATLTGTITLGGNLQVTGSTAATDALFIFALEERTPANSIMITNFSNLTYAAGSFSVTINSSQTGAYRLASGVNSFTDTITLKVDGSEVVELTVGGETVISNRNKYSLSLDSQMLQLNVVALDFVVGDTTGNVYLADDRNFEWENGTVYGRFTSGHNYANQIYGGGDQTSITGNVTLDVESGTVLTTHLFAGGYGGDVGGSTEINLFAGMTANGYVLGGGYNGSVTSGAVINASGGTVNALYGGGRVDVSGASAHVETVTMTLGNGFAALKSNSYVYGGGIAAAAGVTATVTSVTISVNGAGLAYLHGGGQASNGTATVESVTVTVAAGTTFAAYLYGGGRASGSGTSTVGTVDLKITGGTFTYVYGGGYSSGSGISTVNEVNITVNAGTFSGSLYGGAQRSSTGTGTASVGDVSITLDLTGVVNFAANMGVVMGGTTTSVVTGNTTLTLTGSGSNLKTGGGTFTGWLTAVSDYGIDDSKTHTLHFANFVDSDFQARVRGFNHADFSGSTAITVTSSFGWHTGADFSFDLSGRSAMSGTAFMKQETGDLAITEESLFNIILGTDDISGTSGSFLLLDAMNGVDWSFGAECVNLTFGSSSGTGTFNGNAIELEGYLFNLVYEQADGTFLLSWSYDETGNSSRAVQQGILA